jgi:O-antigen/teichoic acid export membrane protein
MLFWRAIAIVNGAVTSILLVRWLGPADRGALAILVVSIGFTAVVLQSGIPEALIFVIGARRYRRESVERAVFAYGGVMMLCAVSIVPLVPGGIYGGVPALRVLSGVAIGFSVMVTILRHLLLAERQFQKYTESVIIEGVTYLSLLLVVKAVVGLSVTLALGAYVGSLFFVLSVLAVRMWRSRQREACEESARWPIVRDCLRQGVHLFVTGLGTFMLQRINYVLLGSVSGLIAVGRFAAASTLPGLFSNLPQQVATVLYAHVSSTEDRDAGVTLTIRVFYVGMAVSLAAVGLVIILREQIVLLLFGRAYAGIGGTLVVLSCATSCLGLGSVLFNALAGRGEQQVGTAITGATVLCLAICSYVMIPAFGEMGAAVAYLVAACVSLLLTIVAFCRRLDVPLGRLFRVPRIHAKLPQDL